MPTQNEMRHCQQCGVQTMHIGKVVNHVLQLLLCVVAGFVVGLLTGSVVVGVIAGFLWAGIVWCTLAAFQPRPACSVCGHSGK